MAMVVKGRYPQKASNTNDAWEPSLKGCLDLQRAQNDGPISRNRESIGSIGSIVVAILEVQAIRSVSKDPSTKGSYPSRTHTFRVPDIWGFWFQKTILFMEFGTKDVKYSVLGPLKEGPECLQKRLGPVTPAILAARWLRGSCTWAEKPVAPTPVGSYHGPFWYPTLLS